MAQQKLLNKLGTYTDSNYVYSVEILVFYINEFNPPRARLMSKSFEQHMKCKCWKEPNKNKFFSPLDIIKKRAKSELHSKRIEDADLSYPIIINGATSWIIDGMHRLARAYLDKKDYIDVIVLDSDILARSIVGNKSKEWSDSDWSYYAYLSLDDLYDIYDLRFHQPNVIHIAACIGDNEKELLSEFKNRSAYVCAHLDEFKDEYISKSYDQSTNWTLDENHYQKYITNFVKSNRDKTIIFAGINDNHLGTKKMYYEIYANKKYFLYTGDESLVKNRCSWLLNEINTDRFKNQIIPDNESFMNTIINSLNYDCRTANISKQNAEWRAYYRSQNYEFLNAEQIRNKII